jgi:hypothetical protein
MTEGERHCVTTDPKLPVEPIPVGSVRLKWLGRRRALQGLVAELSLTSGSLSDVSLELRRGRRVYATATVPQLDQQTATAVLHEPSHRRGQMVPAGHYTLLARGDGRTILRRTVRVPHQ